MQKESTICQSCGLPLISENLGFNADSTINKEYCKFCYQKGSFTSPDLTIEQQTEKLSKMAVHKFGTPHNEARKMAKTILPTLKRWQ